MSTDLKGKKTCVSYCIHFKYENHISFKFTSDQCSVFLSQTYIFVLKTRFCIINARSYTGMNG